ncbi:hypothetical protein ACHQM5_022223 [Ranunculus cassubicifolius]
MLETVQEIGIYLHRFHNLDLFQQGWYRIKITMRWEDCKYTSPGTPARIVQYEAPGLGLNDVLGVWRIDDTDNSFCTQPFRIKYARQDVLLSVMVSFNIALGKYEGPSTSAVILKFELMFAPVLDKGSSLQASPDVSASVHEFRIPPKALLGLHSYCPLHFDSFHAVFVELSVHVILLKDDTCAPTAKVPRDSGSIEEMRHELLNRTNQVSSGQEIHVNAQSVALMKAMLSARDIIIDEIHKISKAINQTIDLTDLSSNLGDNKLIGSIIKGDFRTKNTEASEVRVGSRQVTSEPRNGFQIVNGSLDIESDGMLQSVSKDEIFDAFHSLGDQITVLWSIFLKFHRSNTAKVLEFLRDAWANDRRAEWSIWMVYSKVDMPHHVLRSGLSESSHSRSRSLITRKLKDDPAQTATTRAERHRRSIAQMRINNRSIQDMHIFGDPLRIPVILVDRVVNAPLRTTSGNSFFSVLDAIDTLSISTGNNSKLGSRLAGPQKTSRVLKMVVFVHGFQGHHLDLRLIRNQWLLIDPGVECLMSMINEERTSGDIREMGARLAEEVISFIKRKIEKFSRCGGFRDMKLSFVGHSIGNVIIRTALTESKMEPFLKYLYTYMSVSGPHLGYLYSSNSLFNSGLWLIKKLKATHCIHQLTLTDAPDLQNTFFYKLCKQKTLEHFKNIFLLSSPQDGYVPYHSARIEMCQASSWDNSKKGKIFTEMLNDLWDQIRTPSSEQRMFVRCDVNFDQTNQGRNLNTIIGRAAHIEFLETDVFARFIMWSFPDLFR